MPGRARPRLPDLHVQQVARRSIAGIASRAFHLDLTDAPGRFDAKWIGLSLGTVFDAYGGSLEGGKMLFLGALDWRPWLLWLKQRGE